MTRRAGRPAVVASMKPWSWMVTVRPAARRDDLIDERFCAGEWTGGWVVHPRRAALILEMLPKVPRRWAGYANNPTDYADNARRGPSTAQSNQSQQPVAEDWADPQPADATSMNDTPPAAEEIDQTGQIGRPGPATHRGR